MADPSYLEQGAIDLLLGAEVHALIVESGPNNLRKGNSSEPIATKTKLGWLLSGPVGGSTTLGPAITHHEALELGNLLQKFWLQEEVSVSKPLLTQAEEENELFFRKTHTRNECGQYVVRLPFKCEQEKRIFPGFFKVSETMLLRMEKRFCTNPVFKNKYHEFMQEYIDLQHMAVCSESLKNNHNVFSSLIMEYSRPMQPNQKSA